MIKLNNSFFKFTENLNNNINFIESEDTNKIHSNKINFFVVWKNKNDNS